jgi:predicted RNA-binding protein associated with RNAse of E/G family
VRRFEAGEVIEFREVWEGRTWELREGIVIEDRPELIATYTHPGSPVWFAASTEGKPLRIPEAAWMLNKTLTHEKGVLGLHVPGAEHSVLPVFAATGRFEYWYINLESDLERTERGFQYQDHFLDVVVQPGMRSWKWKDEHELAEVVERCLFSPEKAAAVRTEGERALEWLLARRPPYDRPWEEWKPS